MPQDVVFDAAVDDDDAQRAVAPPLFRAPHGFRPTIFPAEGSSAGHFPDQVPAHQARIGADPCKQGIHVTGFRRQDSPHGALQPQPAGEGPGIHPFHTQLAPGLQKGLQGPAAPPVARKILILPDDQPLQVDAPGFHVLVVDPRVADQGIGHGHHLALVGGVGEDFLVAGHAGVEDHLPQDLSPSGEGKALENVPVLKDQQRGRLLFEQGQGSTPPKWQGHSRSFPTGPGSVCSPIPVLNRVNESPLWPGKVLICETAKDRPPHRIGR